MHSISFLVLSVLIVGLSGVASPQRSIIQYWDLPTGSHIAYLRYVPTPPTKQAPVIFLHGGPGAYIVDHPAIAEEFYNSLAKSGFDVYIYDQIGSGRSARLSDPRQYTVDRHVEDLEGIRQKLGAEQIVLIGDSWGATLGSNYIARYPDRAAKAIFSGPGTLDPTEIPSATYSDAPMTKAAEVWFASIHSQPRYQRMYSMLEHDVLEAYRMVADGEMDPEFDSFVQRSLPNLVCDSGKIPPDEVVHGMGWWVNVMTSLDVSRRQHGMRRALSSVQVPVLILRGGCDYLRWEVAFQYKTIFHNSTIIYVPEAGHAFGYDQPKTYSEAVRAFLLGQPLPTKPYMGITAPPRVWPK